MDPNVTVLSEDDERSQLLTRAVRDDDAAGIKEALELTRVDVNALHDEGGYEAATLLHIAAGRGHIASIHSLLECGAQVDCPDRNRFGDSTPLHYAAMNAQVDAIRALLEAGADLHSERHEVGSPIRSVLHLARSPDPKRQAAIDFFLEAGANVNEPAYEWGEGTLLQQVVRTGDLSLTRRLVDHGAALTGTLLQSVEYGHSQITRWLVDQGAQDPDAIALARAAARDEMEVCKVLMPATTAASPVRLGSALTAAASLSKFQSTTFLLDVGINVNQENASGGNALQAACSARPLNPGFVRFLVERGADVESQNQRTRSRLQEILL